MIRSCRFLLRFLLLFLLRLKICLRVGFKKMFLEFLQVLIFRLLELLLFFVVLGVFIQIIVFRLILVHLEM